jgi:hypothetical protein
MKKLLMLLAIAGLAWFAWTQLRPKLVPTPSSPDTTPAANMRQRIDNRSGVAPE